MARVPVLDSELTRMTKDGRTLISLARRLGWLTVWQNQNKKVIQLIPPDDAEGTSPMNVPTTNVNHKRLRSLARAMIRMTPDHRVFEAMQADAVLAMMAGGISPELATEIRNSMEKRPAIPRPVAPPVPPPQPAFEGDDDDSLPGFDDEPVVEVSRRPFSAVGGQGVTYESEYADEVTYSDGSVRWVCAHPECAYESDKGGRNVSHHYVQKHGSLRMKGDRRPRHQGKDHPRSEPVSHRETAVQQVVEEKPEGDRLAQWLQQFIDSEVERELAKHTAELNKKMEALDNENFSLTMQLAECREEAAKYVENMTAIRDMLNDLIR